MTAVDTQGEVAYVQVVQPSCPTGVSPSAYLTVATGLPSVWLWAVNIRIPPGHAGTTGIALLDGAQFIVPYAAGQEWIVGDDDNLTFPYSQQIGANTALAAYNDGTYTHGWQVRLTYTPLSAMAPDGASIGVPDLAELLATAERATPTGG